MIRRFIVLAALVMLPFVSNSQSLVQFDSELDRTRYYALIQELRCPKCQNQNLADSDSVIAEDLRNQVYVMIKDGRSDQEIVQFMVERYGEFVLYRPAFSLSNSVLWGAPAALILIVLFVAVSRRKAAPQAATAKVDDLQLQQRLDEIDSEKGAE